MRPIRDIDPVFVGRTESLAELSALIDGGARLITVLGGPGLGKSRLALRFAGSIQDRFESAWLVDLSAAASADDVLAALASTLGIETVAAGPEGAEALARALESRGRLLLVLDGLEGAVDGAARVLRTCLQGAPELVVIATSRSPLAVASETRFELEPLDPEEARSLFSARAAQRVRGFRLDPDETETVDEVLRLLDRIPLAIELAASRVPTLPLSELCRRLADGLAWLEGRRRDAPARHTTMASAIDWSWRLLRPEEQRALSELSVLAGPFTPQAAEAILSPACRPALDLLGALRDHSLVQAVEAGGRRCLRLFDSVRTFARAHLEEEARVLDRHARFFADRFFVSTDVMYGVSPEVSLEDLDREREDLFSAMCHALERWPEGAVRCAIVLARVTTVRGPGWRGWEVLERAIACARSLSDQPELLARVLIARAAFSRAWLGRLDLTTELEEAIALLRPLPLRALESEARCYLGVMRTESGSFDDAERELAVAQAMADADGHPVAVTLARGARAMYAFERGRLQRSIHAYDETLASDGARASARMTARYRTSRARARYELGDLDGAQVDYREAAELQEQVDDRLYLPVTLLGLSVVELTLGQREAAQARVEVVRRIVVGSGSRRLAAAPSILTGWLRLDDGRAEAARAAFRAALGQVESRRGASLARLGTGLSWAMEGAIASAIPELEAAAAGEPTDVTPICRASLAAVGAAFAVDSALVHGALEQAEADADGRESRRVLDLVAFARSRVTVRDAAAPVPAADWPELRVLRRVVDPGTSARPWTYEPSRSVLTPPEGPPIALAGRPLLARLVDALARRREDAPGRATSKAELIATLWPRDQSRSEAVVNRLWVAISTLRKLGLERLLVRKGDGYLFDPSTPFEVRDRAPTDRGPGSAEAAP